MTAMNQYLADARISELRETRAASKRMRVSHLLEEASQILKGALLPVSGSGADLGSGLQRDLGLR